MCLSTDSERMKQNKTKPSRPPSSSSSSSSSSKKKKESKSVNNDKSDNNAILSLSPLSRLSNNATILDNNERTTSNKNKQENKQENDKSPRKKSGIQRMKRQIISGYIFCTFLYASMWILLHKVTTTDLAPHSKYCPKQHSGSSITTTRCTRYDLLAFQIVSLVMLSYLGILGFVTFFTKRRVFRTSSSLSSSLSSSSSSSSSWLFMLPTPQGRILGWTRKTWMESQQPEQNQQKLQKQRKDKNNDMHRGQHELYEADCINAAIIVFQGWDFIMSLFVEEHRTVIMLCHHLFAFVCGWFSLHYEVVPYYAVYFGGVSEFSSIFLAFVDLYQYFPPSSFSSSSPSISFLHQSIEQFSQPMFVLSFFTFRIIGWIYNTILLWKDSFYLMKRVQNDNVHIGNIDTKNAFNNDNNRNKNDNSSSSSNNNNNNNNNINPKSLLERYCPGSTWFLIYLMTMSIILGALQLFWMMQIIEKVMEVMNN